MTVYIVDDDPGVNDALSTSIQTLGYEVISCPDPLALFRREPPGSGDVVFLDLMLPGIPGGEVIRWLLQLKDPPRIVPISALSQELARQELRNTDMRALRKPLSLDTVIAALKPDWS
jgi:DNA-binding response OmpR family regulator